MPSVWAWSDVHVYKLFIAPFIIIILSEPNFSIGTFDLFNLRPDIAANCV